MNKKDILGHPSGTEDVQGTLVSGFQGVPELSTFAMMRIFVNSRQGSDTNISDAAELLLNMTQSQATKINLGSVGPYLYNDSTSMNKATSKLANNPDKHLSLSRNFFKSVGAADSKTINSINNSKNSGFCSSFPSHLNSNLNVKEMQTSSDSMDLNASSTEYSNSNSHSNIYNDTKQPFQFNQTLETSSGNVSSNVSDFDEFEDDIEESRLSTSSCAGGTPFSARTDDEDFSPDLNNDSFSSNLIRNSSYQTYNGLNNNNNNNNNSNNNNNNSNSSIISVKKNKKCNDKTKCNKSNSTNVEVMRRHNKNFGIKGIQTVVVKTKSNKSGTNRFRVQLTKEVASTKKATKNLDNYNEALMYYEIVLLSTDNISCLSVLLERGNYKGMEEKGLVADAREYYILLGRHIYLFEFLQKFKKDKEPNSFENYVKLYDNLIIDVEFPSYTYKYAHKPNGEEMELEQSKQQLQGNQLPSLFMPVAPIPQMLIFPNEIQSSHQYHFQRQRQADQIEGNFQMFSNPSFAIQQQSLADQRHYMFLQQQQQQYFQQQQHHQFLMFTSPQLASVAPAPARGSSSLSSEKTEVFNSSMFMVPQNFSFPPKGFSLAMLRASSKDYFSEIDTDFFPAYKKSLEC